MFTARYGLRLTDANFRHLSRAKPQAVNRLPLTAAGPGYIPGESM